MHAPCADCGLHQYEHCTHCIPAGYVLFVSIIQEEGGSLGCFYSTLCDGSE